MARKTREEALETRQKLLAAALEVMSEKPFSKVSMSEIAERIGLSKGATYWHFKNKDDLLINVIEYFFDRTEKELEISVERKNSADAIRRYFRNKMKMATESDDFQKFNALMLRRTEWPETLRSRVFEVLIGRS